MENNDVQESLNHCDIMMTSLSTLILCPFWFDHPLYFPFLKCYKKDIDIEFREKHENVSRQYRQEERKEALMFITQSLSNLYSTPLQLPNEVD